MHLQPVFAGCEVVGGTVAEAFFRDGLCLPSGTAMSEADIARVGVVWSQRRQGPPGVVSQLSPVVSECIGLGQSLQSGEAWQDSPAVIYSLAHGL